MSGCDLNVAKVDAGVEHGGDEGVSQHVGMHSGNPYTGLFDETMQASGGAVAVHPCASGGEEDGAGRPVVDGPFDSATNGRR